jgi:hypothetical protein
LEVFDLERDLDLFLDLDFFIPAALIVEEDLGFLYTLYVLCVLARLCLLCGVKVKLFNVLSSIEMGAINSSLGDGLER